MLDLLELLGLKGIAPSQNQPLQEPVNMETQSIPDASGIIAPEPINIEDPAAASSPIETPQAPEQVGTLPNAAMPENGVQAQPAAPSTDTVTGWEKNPDEGPHPLEATQPQTDAGSAQADQHPHSFSSEWHTEPLPVPDVANQSEQTPAPQPTPEVSQVPVRTDAAPSNIDSNAYTATVLINKDEHVSFPYGGNIINTPEAASTPPKEATISTPKPVSESELVTATPPPTNLETPAPDTAAAQIAVEEAAANITPSPTPEATTTPTAEPTTGLGTQNSGIATGPQEVTFK